MFYDANTAKNVSVRHVSVARRQQRSTLNGLDARWEKVVLNDYDQVQDDGHNVWVSLLHAPFPGSDRLIILIGYHWAYLGEMGLYTLGLTNMTTTYAIASQSRVSLHILTVLNGPLTFLGRYW